MRKSFIFAFAALAAVCSCQKTQPAQELTTVNEDSAISFDNYLTSAVTRATNITADSVKTMGFGVFAYSTQDQPIEKYTKEYFEPNFMYNQQVTYKDAAWTYAPVKYWPNNTGAKVSFYAYAPYCAEFTPDVDPTGDDHTVTPETNTYLQKVLPTQKGMRLMLGYDYNGPGIEYTIPDDPTGGVDLLWGEYINAGGATGKAAIDLTKPSVTEKIKFQFRHALSRIDFKVKVYNDVVRPSTSNNELADGTTIYIQSVTLKGLLPNTATLRLYDGSWNIEKENCSNVVFDTEDFTETIVNGLDKGEAKEEIALLSGIDADQQKAGKNNYITLIPGSTFNIEIVYDVVTVDAANPKNNSTVTNTILSQDQYTLEKGYAYTFTLNIGMTSVKFDADTDVWNLTDQDQQVDLPANTI